MSKKKNPLYVVKKKGKVVEEAQGVVDALIKKLGMESTVKLILNIFKDLVGKINNYSLLDELNKFLTKFIETYNLFTKPYKA